MTGGLASVVEGKSELQTVPALLRRVQERLPTHLDPSSVQILKPWRVKRTQMWTTSTSTFALSVARHSPDLSGPPRAFSRRF